MASMDLLPEDRNIELKKVSKEEMEIIKSQNQLKQSEIALKQEVVTGVINLARDLIELKKVHLEGEIQFALMQEKGDLIRQELQAFREKNGLERETRSEKLAIMTNVIEKIDKQLDNNNTSNEVKVAVLNFYRTALSEILKS